MKTSQSQKSVHTLPSDEGLSLPYKGSDLSQILLLVIYEQMATLRFCGVCLIIYKDLLFLVKTDFIHKMLPLPAVNPREAKEPWYRIPVKIGQWKPCKFYASWPLST